MAEKSGIIKKMNALKNQCKKFANHYSTIETQVFSKEVLQQLSHNGFLGWMIPTSLGGQGKSARQMILAGESLMTHCKNFGITLSWVIHEIVTYWFIHTFGNDHQHKRFLPKLLSGEQVGALAISEPGVGPHPKHLKTQAEISESICLNGEKTYLTNGPIADLFVVIAISHIDAGRKQYSAFIVTNDAPGFHYAAPLDFPFVQTSPHGGIVLNNCIIPKEQLLGELNTAYNSMVKPFREIEDTLMMGPILGGMQCQLTYLINDVYNQKIALTEAQQLALGQLQVHLSTGRAIAEKAAQILDNNNCAIDLLLGFRQLAMSFQTCFASFINQLPQLNTRQVKTLTGDLRGIGQVASKVMKQKQITIGKQLINQL